MCTTFPRLLACAALAALLGSSVSSKAQQNYIGRYDAYAGFAVIDSPMLGLNEHDGFHVQAGINPTAVVFHWRGL